VWWDYLHKAQVEENYCLCVVFLAFDLFMLLCFPPPLGVLVVVARKRSFFSVCSFAGFVLCIGQQTVTLVGPCSRASNDGVCNGCICFHCRVVVYFTSAWPATASDDRPIGRHVRSTNYTAEALKALDFSRPPPRAVRKTLFTLQLWRPALHRQPVAAVGPQQLGHASRRRSADRSISIAWLNAQSLRN